MPKITLSQGTLQYRDEGSGPAVVFIHGLLVDGEVWRPAVDRLSARSRCVVPDLPLGSHRTPLAQGADLSPVGLARLIAELIERLELSDVTLVGNDTGGALCQLVVIGHPDRIGRLVLTNCDAFEHFPPPAFAFAVRALARVPGAIPALGQLGRVRSMRRLALAVAPLTVRPVADELVHEWIAPLRNGGIRRDLRKVLRGISPRYTIAAADRLAAFDHPTLIVWGTEDRFFPFSDAERLASVMPNAQVERVANARTFVQLDAPDRLAELIGSFVHAGEPSKP